MPVSGIQSGHQIVQMSQQMAEKAAHGINDNLGKVKEEIASHNIDLAKVADVAITASTPSLPLKKLNHSSTLRKLQVTTEWVRPSLRKTMKSLAAYSIFTSKTS